LIEGGGARDGRERIREELCRETVVTLRKADGEIEVPSLVDLRGTAAAPSATLVGVRSRFRGEESTLEKSLEMERGKRSGYPHGVRGLVACRAVIRPGHVGIDAASCGLEQQPESIDPGFGCRGEARFIHGRRI
jgi:hypothetical protein